MVLTPQRIIIWSTIELNDSRLANKIARLYLKKRKFITAFTRAHHLFISSVSTDSKSCTHLAHIG